MSMILAQNEGYKFALIHASRMGFVPMAYG